MRALGSVVALAGLVMLAIFGTLALAILAVGGFAWFLWFRWRLHRLRRHTGNRPADAMAANGDDVIEGDYIILNERRNGTN